MEACAARRVLRWIGLGVLITGCYISSVRRSGATPSDTPKPALIYANLEARLRQEVAQWQGVPYRLGGLHMQGVDCSAFVQNVFVGLFGLYLPRNTAQQARFGRTVQRDALRPGDLVFFHIGRRTRHVGIYLGQDEFAHASRSQGVIVSRLSEPYWAKRYWIARRVLEVRADSVDSAGQVF
ncbi:MAG: NlpC/P60 family protein [Bacteroidetes bacterium]|nr:NlpC/P60 family protein [Rhodothermia bacterium]MCS7155354.1 NlpC/P60 family protein [Bacteroidota bacterium]MCX7907553.1 NlpC/P60 family protein [Bacteroidota bacterium]MDW8138547.1 NlpC/P60 family protein [Bacteroidota bacterium]